jgi:hypothetical protein
MAAAVATLALCHGAGTALTLALPGRLIASPLVSAAALDPFALIAAPLRLALVALRGH